MTEHQTHWAETTGSPRPAIYVRSATTGDNQLEERLEDARDLARMNGLDVAADDCIAEQGSGANIDRPELQRVLGMAERGEISHLVTARLSNLSRSDHDLHYLLVMLAEAGVAVITTPGTDEPEAAPDIATRTLVVRR